jgi:hypothetical protein
MPVPTPEGTGSEIKLAGLHATVKHNGEIRGYAQTVRLRAICPESTRPIRLLVLDLDLPAGGIAAAFGATWPTLREEAMPRPDSLPRSRMPTLRLLPELEDSLRQLPGVKAASVVTGPDAVPTEVHVLAAPGKPAKQIVRDVQSLSMARYDIDIDHRIVSVVQIGEPELPPTVRQELDGTVEDPDDEAAGNPLRPAITAITVRTGKGETSATVSLAVGEDSFEGTSTGPAGQSHRARLVAAATVDAVADLLGQPCEVESAGIVSTGTREVALTVLTLTVPRTGEQILTGSAVVRGDEADAVARSVLAALNRQLTD